MDCNGKDPNQLSIIKDQLLDCGSRFESSQLFPTLIPEAYSLIISDPFAFCIGICLDAGAQAKVIWTIPYYLKNQLGHLDPCKIQKMSLEDLADAFAHLPKRPRFINRAPRTVKELTEIVINECEGDASRMWIGKSAAEVNRTFRSIYGVGSGIANMAPLLIESAHGNRYQDRERPKMDIKPDVHTRRVLYRLGVAEEMTDVAAVDAAKCISPEFPGAVDGALWWIGQRWCHAQDPECSICCLNSICVKRID